MATAVHAGAFRIRSDRYGTVGAVMPPAVLPRITPGIAPTFWTAGRFLPLGLGGQAIMPPRLPAQPVAVRLGIMPADAHHWMLALAHGWLPQEPAKLFLWLLLSVLPLDKCRILPIGHRIPADPVRRQIDLVSGCFVPRHTITRLTPHHE